jgi:hypothetical protein
VCALEVVRRGDGNGMDFSASVVGVLNVDVDVDDGIFKMSYSQPWIIASLKKDSEYHNSDKMVHNSF